MGGDEGWHLESSLGDSALVFSWVLAAATPGTLQAPLSTFQACLAGWVTSSPCRWESWGSERSSHSAKVPQQPRKTGNGICLSVFGLLWFPSAGRLLAGWLSVACRRLQGTVFRSRGLAFAFPGGDFIIPSSLVPCALGAPPHPHRTWRQRPRGLVSPGSPSYWPPNKYLAKSGTFTYFLK